MNPIAYRLEGSSISYIVHQKYAMSSMEIRSSNSPEPFLTNSIPDLANKKTLKPSIQAFLNLKIVEINNAYKWQIHP